MQRLFSVSRYLIMKSTGTALNEKKQLHFYICHSRYPSTKVFSLLQDKIKWKAEICIIVRFYMYGLVRQFNFSLSTEAVEGNSRLCGTFYAEVRFPFLKLNKRTQVQRNL